MYQRSDTQLAQIADDIRANMYYQLQSLVSDMNVGEGRKESISNMKTQSSVLFILNGFTTNAQKNAAANQAAGLSYAYPDGYGENGYFANDYAE